MEEITQNDWTLTRYFMLYLEEYETAVMADFHLGFEDVMASRGLSLPRIQKKYILSLLESIFEKYSPKRMVIVGDLKHEFSKNMPQEWDEIEEIIDYITANSELILIRGNHDNYLKTILSRRGLKLHNHYRIGEFLFIHGHKKFNFEGDSVVVMGHEHPSVSIRDEVFAVIKIPCFLVSREIIVLPAVSPYASGNDLTKGDFISPILIEKHPSFDVFGIYENDIIPLGGLNKIIHSHNI